MEAKWNVRSIRVLCHQSYSNAAFEDNKNKTFILVCVFGGTKTVENRLMLFSSMSSCAMMVVVGGERWQ